MDYSRAADGFPKDSLKGVDWFSALEMPEKQDLISVVTSNKAFTHYQRKRIAFIEELTRLIPDRLVIYGHGQRSIDDKKDALLPYRYHLAIENCDGPDLWTEKLADPFLCGAFPFYAGCTNVESYFPAGSFEYIDLQDVGGGGSAHGFADGERALAQGGQCHGRGAAPGADPAQRGPLAGAADPRGDGEGGGRGAEATAADPV